MVNVPELKRGILDSVVDAIGNTPIVKLNNITKDLNKLGIPTGAMPDGSANLTVAFTFANTKEIYRGVKKDASVQVGFQPGSMMLTAFGSNGGGPITVQGLNTSPGQAFGDIN